MKTDIVLSASGYRGEKMSVINDVCDMNELHQVLTLRWSGHRLRHVTTSFTTRFGELPIQKLLQMGFAREGESFVYHHSDYQVKLEAEQTKQDLIWTFFIGGTGAKDIPIRIGLIISNIIIQIAGRMQGQIQGVS